jgi:2-polyprenyl-6-methoxyphenol hydroxylase-like FAD-dependent oxidoreductase
MTLPPIAIIGAGPCGLTLARLLECKGIDYVVYERDESETSNRAGGSLDIHAETGQHALQEGGLFDEFRKYARYDDTSFTLADKSGNKLVQFGEGRDAPEIDRRELRQILLDAIPKGKIKWGHALRGATVGEGNMAVLRFANGVVVSGFKLVVGADGAWSKVRPMVRSDDSFSRHYVSMG